MFHNPMKYKRKRGTDKKKEQPLPKGTSETEAIPLISSLNGYGSVSTIKGWKNNTTNKSEYRNHTYFWLRYLTVVGTRWFCG